MPKMPLDPSFNPELLEAYLLISKMMEIINDPQTDELSKQITLQTLGVLAKTFVECVDNTEN